MIDSTNIFSQRNKTIDILRALTMLLMIFVNHLWTISDYPVWLGHAEIGQDMLGLADIVFPCFLITVGMSIPYAIERRLAKDGDVIGMIGHILTRTLALLVMGVFIVNTGFGVSPETGLSYKVYRLLMVVAFFLIWNIYPRTEKWNANAVFTILKVLGLLLLLYLGIIFRDQNGEVMSSRWWGILGVIGWSYFICAFIYLLARNRLKYLVPIWIFLVLVCILQTPLINGEVIFQLPNGNIVDQMLNIFPIGNGAMVAFTLSGIMLSVVDARLRESKLSKKIIVCVAAVSLFLIAGFISNNYWIISKLARTIPWVFYCIGITIASYAVIRWLESIDKVSWYKIIEPAGTSTLTCYLVPYILYAISFITFPDWLKVGYIGILQCIAFAFFTIGVTYLLGKVHIKLKI